MNAKEYNKVVKDLANKYNLQKELNRAGYIIPTKFGNVRLNSEYMPKIKLAVIHSKLIDGDIKAFKEETGYNSMNNYSGKLNVYFNNPADCLDELQEYIENLQYLN